MISAVGQAEKTRLIEFFGEAGAEVILDHLDNLEKTFGSASSIILKVMEGRLEKPKNES